MTFRDVDRGANQLILSLKPALRIRVGVQGDEAQKSTDGGLTVADVATFHELGTKTIPARSFIRGWFDQKFAQNQQLLSKATSAIVRGRPLAQVGEVIAIKFQEDMKGRMIARIPPPLKPATIAAKTRKDGKSAATPLILTSQLLGSVTGISEVISG